MPDLLATQRIRRRFRRLDRGLLRHPPPRLRRRARPALPRRDRCRQSVRRQQTPVDESTLPARAPRVKKLLDVFLKVPPGRYCSYLLPKQTLATHGKNITNEGMPQIVCKLIFHTASSSSSLSNSTWLVWTTKCGDDDTVSKRMRLRHSAKK